MTLPIIAGFAPDPTICRVGDDYYLANSSFEYFPGAPIYHSVDLVNWKQLGNIIDRPEQMTFGGDSGGIYGSTLRHHDGVFWFVTTNMNNFRAGQVIYTAEDPAGPWSDPVRVPAIGIDPDLSWDSAGTCRLTLKVPSFDPSGEGEGFIGQAVIDPVSGEILSAVKSIWAGSGQSDTEGPHLYDIDGYWYLVVAEGGTQRGHMVTVARSVNPDGPFELSPVHPTLTHRSTTHSVQATGHADLVSISAGHWAMVYLGTRPWGMGYGFHLLGRETFAAGVVWEDGWPTVDESTFPAAVADYSFVDDFAGTRVHPRWVSPGRSLEFAQSDHGEFRLTSDSDLAALVTRVRDKHWRAEAAVCAVSGAAGMILRLDSEFWCELRIEGDLTTARAHLGELSVDLGTLVASGSIDTIAIESVPAPTAGWFPPSSPDRLRFTVRDERGEQVLGEIDGRYFSTEVAGGFTGRMIGVFVDHGSARIRRVVYGATEPPRT